LTSTQHLIPAVVPVLQRMLVSPSRLGRHLSRALRRELSSSPVTHQQAAVLQENRWSYVCGPSSTPLLGLTIGQAVDSSADRFGDREGLVVVHQGIRRNFTQLREEVERLAAGLVELGLQPGDRLGIWGPNTHEWYLTQFACAKAGLILVNINPAYQPSELKWALFNFEC